MILFMYLVCSLCRVCIYVYVFNTVYVHAGRYLRITVYGQTLLNIDGIDQIFTKTDPFQKGMSKKKENLPSSLGCYF